MLIVCPTPIGNLDDVTPRQHRALEEADIIACEDTRRTGKLLSLLEIERIDGVPRLWRYDDHSAAEETPRLIEEMQGGETVVLASDAGTPTISDPGYRLVRGCREADIEVVALPGPVAGIVALSGSGLPTDRFFFEGFLATTSTARQNRLEALDELGTTVVLYASPHRILEVLSDVEAVCGSDRELCVARELTKLHEEYLTGEVAEIRRRLDERMPVHGEFVICIGPGRQEADGDQKWAEADRLIAALDGQDLSSRTIKEVVDEVCDVPRSKIYDRIEAVADDE